MGVKIIVDQVQDLNSSNLTGGHKTKPLHAKY